ncbi:MAG: beta-glucanase (GH16 family) [Paraglaciecola sp.]|jgi:beta-glucanase (GH16 family)
MKIDKLKTIFLCIGLFFLFNSCSQGQNEVQNEIQNVSQDGWQMVWSDEFDYEGLPDTKKWSYDVGDGCPNVCAWGNNELEHYTKDSLKNARVENGHLIIEAHKELIGNSRYSSARLVSKDKGDWKYGKIKVRAKLPSGIGTWPAIWMLSTDWEYGGWPESGEIDIMEHVGYDRDTVVGTVHTKAYHHSIGTHQNGKIAKADFEENFHIFVIEWSEDKIDFFTDGEKYFTFENEKKTFNEWPFDKRFHLILNLAVGGNWGGKMGVDEKIWPQKMEVDYVRVYQ